ncbi:MAG: dihydrofolate reductase family protein [Cypionkella sp.]|uniref:dihydrofolate reductase family protein n=1 Tax=Cypionkella sp. TaxID=2811411 RepID=UPI002ABA6340|nr:dihydrofolate reductase family protein [Cypionkella sp.]MDZ4310728.1 dihydrofolate reductase family protein [Cypionkella sp.]MDZ4392058.1 dihydrofolate reductase family protein [Cypionkella sp.]
MGKLTYGMMMSIDGFLADASSYFDAEVLGFINDEMPRYGTEIYGRRMYDEMVYWETYHGQKDGSKQADEFARLWKGFDKLVISTTLEQVSSGNTQILRAFRPEDIRQLKAASTKDISVAGPTLAAHFIKAGLVDEFALYTVPVVLGTGNPVFRDIEQRLDLDLIEERRFASGMNFQRYAPRKKGK